MQNEFKKLYETQSKAIIEKNEKDGEHIMMTEPEYYGDYRLKEVEPHWFEITNDNNPKFTAHICYKKPAIVYIEELQKADKYVGKYPTIKPTNGKATGKRVDMKGYGDFVGIYKPKKNKKLSINSNNAAVIEDIFSGDQCHFVKIGKDKIGKLKKNQRIMKFEMHLADNLLGKEQFKAEIVKEFQTMKSDNLVIFYCRDKKYFKTNMNHHFFQTDYIDDILSFYPESKFYITEDCQLLAIQKNDIVGMVSPYALKEDDVQKYINHEFKHQSIEKPIEKPAKKTAAKPAKPKKQAAKKAKKAATAKTPPPEIKAAPAKIDNSTAKVDTENEYNFIECFEFLMGDIEAPPPAETPVETPTSHEYTLIDWLEL